MSFFHSHCGKNVYRDMVNVTYLPPFPTLPRDFEEKWVEKRLTNVSRPPHT